MPEMDRYPEVEPYQTGMLDVGRGSRTLATV
jgi:hypothetical protein